MTAFLAWKGGLKTFVNVDTLTALSAVVAVLQNLDPHFGISPSPNLKSYCSLGLNYVLFIGLNVQELGSAWMDAWCQQCVINAWADDADGRVVQCDAAWIGRMTEA